MNELDAFCRRDLAAFTQKAFNVLEPATDYIHNWHADCIAEHLQAVWEHEIQYLIINMPPRELKTHTTSISFPAWGLGNNPSIRFMLTSFKSSLAEKMTRKTRMLMKSEWYARCFPDAKISPELDRQYYFETTQRGQYFSSAMSSVTGEGCDIQICFPKGTCVQTDNGVRCISTIRPSDKVWSFNHATGKPELRGVKKIFARPCSSLIEVRTACGVGVLCTPKHPFWVVGKGYREAESLCIGDEVITRRIPEDEDFVLCDELRLLQKRIQEEASGLYEGYKICEQGVLLLKQLFEDAPQLQEQKSLQDLREQDRKPLEEVLRELQECLFQKTEEVGLHKAVQIYQAINRIQRQIQVHKWSQEQIVNNPPHRRKSDEQRAREPDDNVQIMSREDAPELHTGTIQSIRQFGSGEVTVYDFAVEGNSNFFAEGILVHNCDDPVNPDEALSDTIRGSANETIRGTLFSRFNNPKTGRFVLNMQRLHEDDPTGNLLKEQGWYLLKLPAENRTSVPIKYSIRGMDWELGAGELLNPNRLDREVLDKKLDLLGEYNYSGQFLQEPVPIGGGELREEWLQYYANGSINANRMNIFILVDPANEKKKTSDWSVFSVIGLGEDNNYYLLDMVRDRLNPTERVNMLFMLHRKWNALTGKPPKVGYEKYGMMTDTHYIDQKKNEEAYHFSLTELGGQQKKEDRIRRIIPDMQMSRWYVPHNMPYVDGEGRMLDLVSEMKSEMKSFPRARFDDILDCITRIYEPSLFAVFPMAKATLTEQAVSGHNDAGYSDFMDF